MKKLLILLLLLPVISIAQESEFRTYYIKAIEAYKAKSYPEFYRLIKEANALHPYHQGILYQLGIAAALNNHKAEAIENLQKAIQIDNSFHLAGLPDFNNIKDSPEFKNLLAFQIESGKPIVKSDTAFIIKDRALHPEGIAFDAGTQTFYIGSIHKRKIVKVTNGKATDFYAPGAQGMSSVFGLRIDPVRKLIWACSSPTPEMENFDSTARSAVYKLDLASGKLLEKYERPRFERDGTFGDLIISKRGDVYVSDGQTNTIFHVNEKTKKLEPWFNTSEFWNMQGMAFSEDDTYLFISDYIKGIFRIEMKTKSVTAVSCTLPVSLKGIDGLSYYKGSLIAVQNGVTPLRVTRYLLNADKASIVKLEILDRAHPSFNEPTIGVVSGDDFFYIANSQWNGYDKNHHILPEHDLQDIVVLHRKLTN